MNYLSTPIEYAPTPTDANFELLAKVSLMQQGRYDVAKEKVQQTLDAFGLQKMLRPQDNEYIQAKLNSITNKINSYGDKNLAHSNVTDSIMGDIKSAANDPFIISAMENTYRKQNHDKQVEETRKKNPGLYSDVNYQDSLDMAGYDDYMKGKRNDLGELRYKNYINAPKVLEDNIQKWAKDFGYHTEWVDGDTSQLIYTNSKKEVLTKNDIINKLSTSLDPSLKEQLQIDARYYYKGQSPIILETDVTNYYKKQNASIESEILKIKAAMANATEDEKVKYLNDQQRYEELLRDNKKKIDSKSFDLNNEKYNVYTNNLFENIADNYDRDEVVDVKYIDNNLKIAQFNADIEYKTNVLEQGQQRLDIEKQKLGAMNLANNIAMGSVTDRKEEDLSEKTDTQIAEAANRDNYVALKEALKTDDVYNSIKDEAKKDEYIKNLIKNDTAVNINTDTLSPLVRQKLNDYKTTAFAVYNSKVKINKALGDATQTVYRDLLGGGAKLENLAITMPITAKFAQNKTPFDKLDKRSKVLVMHEIANNTLKYSSKSDEERHTLEVYIKNLEEQDFLSEKDKKYMRAQSQDNENVFLNAVSGVWEGIKGAGKIALSGINELPGAITGDTDVTFTGLLSNDLKGAEKAQRQRYLSAGVNLLNAAQSVANINKKGLDYAIPLQDTNITELEAGDLNKVAKKEAVETMNSAIQTATNFKQSELKKVVPTIKDLRALSFNPDDKSQKPMVTTIETQVAALGGAPLEKGSVYETSITPDKKGINVRYLPQKGKEKVDIVIPIESIPTLTTALTDKSGSYYNSKLNLNAISREFSYKIPEDSEVKRKLLVKLSDTYGEEILPKTLMQALSNGDSTLLSQVQIRSMAKNKTPETTKEINNIAEEVYKVQWVSTGYSWRGIVKDSAGKIVNIDGKDAIVEVNKNFDEGEMRLQSIDLINKTKTLLLQNILKQD